jgi:hypothetical protein
MPVQAPTAQFALQTPSIAKTPREDANLAHPKAQPKGYTNWQHPKKPMKVYTNWQHPKKHVDAATASS